MELSDGEADAARLHETVAVRDADNEGLNSSDGEATVGEGEVVRLGETEELADGDALRVGVTSFVGL